jgi:hypothetical protein
MRSSYAEPAHQSGNALAQAPRVRSGKRSTRLVGVDRAASGRVSSTVKRRGDSSSR